MHPTYKYRTNAEKIVLDIRKVLDKATLTTFQISRKIMLPGFTTDSRLKSMEEVGYLSRTKKGTVNHWKLTAKGRSELNSKWRLR